jgi:O-antigen ligase
MSPAAARRAATVLTLGLVPMAAIYIADSIQRGAILNAIARFAGSEVEPRLSFRDAAQTVYILAMLIFPALLVAIRRGWRGLALGLVAALLIGTLVTDYTSPLLGFLIGCLAWWLVRRWGATAARAMIAPVVLGYLAAPFLVAAAVKTGLFKYLHTLAPLSWDIRLDIWAFAVSKMADHPLRGLGLDAARNFPGAIPLHTHDAPIQLWLELGLPGAALAAAFFAWVFWRIGDLAHERRDQAAVAAGALTTYIVIGALSFGVWQEWWIALGALTIIFCRVERRGWNDAVKVWAQDDLAPLPH